MTAPNTPESPPFRCALCDGAIPADADHWLVAGLTHCRHCAQRYALYTYPYQRGDRARIEALLGGDSE